MNVAISEIGIVRIGMIEARIDRRKNRMTRTTSPIASRIVWNTAWIDRSMNTLSSLPISADSPSGRPRLISGSTACSAFDTSSGLAVACLMTPTAIAGAPL